MKSILALALVSGFLVLSCKKETTSTTTNTDTILPSDTIVKTVPTDTVSTMPPMDTVSTTSGKMDTVRTKK